MFCLISLRQLTSFEDKIRRPNPSLQSNVEGKLKALMSNVDSNAYSKSTMDGKYLHRLQAFEAAFF